MSEEKKFMFKPTAENAQAANNNRGPESKELGTFTPVQNDALFLMYSWQKISSTVVPMIHECTEHIFSLADFSKNDKSIELRREGLKEWSLEQICKELLLGTTLKWNQHPSYYGALILEYDVKHKAALALIPDNNGESETT